MTGVSPTFDTYKDDLGSDLAQPTITEIGGGAYKFTPNIISTPTRCIVYVVNGGVTANPRRLARFVRPEDYFPDMLLDINDVQFGRWKIFNSGGDANRMVLYRPDGSILKKFDLKDVGGASTVNNPFERNPV